jgi:hypothetical protein
MQFQLRDWWRGWSEKARQFFNSSAVRTLSLECSSSLSLLFHHYSEVIATNCPAIFLLLLVSCGFVVGYYWYLFCSYLVLCLCFFLVEKFSIFLQLCIVALECSFNELSWIEGHCLYYIIVTYILHYGIIMSCVLWFVFFVLVVHLFVNILHVFCYLNHGHFQR